MCVFVCVCVWVYVLELELLSSARVSCVSFLIRQYIYIYKNIHINIVSLSIQFFFCSFTLMLLSSSLYYVLDRAFYLTILLGFQLHSWFAPSRLLNFIVIINLLVTNSLLKTFTIFSYLVTSGVNSTAFAVATAQVNLQIFVYHTTYTQ